MTETASPSPRSGPRPTDAPDAAAPAQPRLDAETLRVYVKALETLDQAGVPFLIGGAYALDRYTGVARHTKDLDVFLRQRDCAAALAALGAAGYVTEVTFPHWLAKAYAGDRFIDVIFSSGNGIAEVDDAWFTYAVPAHVLGVPVGLCPPEEMIWSKAFIMERERYDGADIAHLLLTCGPRLDWRRLLARFGQRWRVLLSHLVLFSFIYPGECGVIPAEVLDQLWRRLQRERAQQRGGGRVCQGTLLSREQYLVDVRRRGYADGRLAPAGEMTLDEIADWTAAIPPATVDHQRGRPAGRARRRRR